MKVRLKAFISDGRIKAYLKKEHRKLFPPSFLVTIDTSTVVPREIKNSV